MSRSNPSSELNNPSVRWFQWSSENKCFRWYNAEIKEQVLVPVPFKFMFLDELITIKGYSESDKSGFYANEIRDMRKEKLYVKMNKVVEASGLYQDVIKQVEGRGAGFCQSVYIAFVDENKQLAIGNIAIQGSAVGPWIDFKKKNNVNEVAIKVATSVEQKTGAVKFNAPVFETTELSKETNEKSIALDVKLQEYFKSYFNRDKEEEVTPEAKSIAEPRKLEGQEKADVAAKLKQELENKPVAKTATQALMDGDNDPTSDLPFK